MINVSAILKWLKKEDCHSTTFFLFAYFLFSASTFFASVSLNSAVSASNTHTAIAPSLITCAIFLSSSWMFSVPKTSDEF